MCVSDSTRILLFRYTTNDGLFCRTIQFFKWTGIRIDARTYARTAWSEHYSGTWGTAQDRAVTAFTVKSFMKDPSPRVLLWRRLRLIKVVYRPFRSCVVRLERVRVSSGREQHISTVSSIWRVTDNRFVGRVSFYGERVCEGTAHVKTIYHLPPNINSITLANNG